ncbi:MAG: Protein tyrosine phosphatase [Burkholderiaceae bacterium]|jgi:protein-tyrosine phosphatase|nr:MAG: Protein tyrosine phosphatase [Burkholderiaceae bacterium]
MPNPSRSLNLEGASNFRDLGGYPAAAGQQVRWRHLFRSDQLGGLTGHDLQQLQTLGLARAFDLRGTHERAATPYQLPGVVQHALPIEPTVVQRMKDLLEAGRTVTAQDTVRLMEQTYRAFVHDNAARFAELFGHLLETDTPLVFHCTAGKDRTGFAAALILLALGVSRETVMQDYLLTNDLFRAPQIDTGRAPREVVQVLWRVQREFLDAALTAVQADWGGIDRYLAEALHVGAAQRHRLVELYLRQPQQSA